MNNLRVLLCVIFIISAFNISAQNKKFDKSLKKIDGYYAAGELEKAAAALKKLKASVVSKMGQSNTYMPGLSLREARISLTLGVLDSFDKTLETALNESKSAFGENSNNYANTLLQVASMYNEYGNYRIAREYVERAKGILGKTTEIEESLKAKIALIEAESMIGQGFSRGAIELLNSWEKFFLQRATDKETKVENNEIKTIRVPEAEIFERFNNYALLKTLQINAHATLGRISLTNVAQDNPDAEHLYSEMSGWIKGKGRFFGETSLADVAYRFAHAKALSKTTTTMTFDNALEFPNILGDLKKRTDPTNALAHEIYLNYLSYLLRKDYTAKYLNVRLEYEKIIERSFPKNSVHRINLKAVEFNSKLSKDKTKDLERDALTVLNSKLLPKNHKTTILVLTFLYDIAIAEKRFESAERYLNQIAETQKELCGENSPAYHLAKLDLANFELDYTNKIDEAGKIYQTSFDTLVKNEIDSQHPKLFNILSHIAQYQEFTDKYSDANKTLKAADYSVREKFDKKDILYAQALDQIATLQLKLGEYEAAEKNLDEALRVIELKDNREYQETKGIHIGILETRANLFAIKGLFDEAEESLDDSADIIKRDSKNLDELDTNHELASLLIMLGRYSTAKELLDEQIPEYEKLYGTNTIRLIEPLVNKARVMLVSGEYSEAEKIAQRANRIAVKTYSEKSTKTAPTQKILAEIFATLGDYTKAEGQLLKALASQEAQFGRNHIEVARTISQLALVKFHKGDNKKEIEKMMVEAREIVGTRLGKTNPQYADILKNVAQLYISEKRFDIAFNSLTIAEDIWKTKTGSKNNINLASIYTLTGDVYYQIKNYNKAEEFFTKGKDLYEKFFSVTHPEYVKIVAKLAKVYYMKKDYKRSKRLIEEALENNERYIQVLFPALDERQKEKYWATIRGDFEFYNTLAFSNLEDFKDLAGKAYNNQLLTKALLLSSSIKMRERILNSTDTELKSQFSLWLQKKEQVTVAMSMSAEQLAENQIDPVALQQEVERLEKDLSQRSADFSQSFESKKITYDEVRKTLKPNEVAIEMIRYRHFNHSLTDSVVYAVLYLRADQSKPKVILLNNGKKMETRFFKYYRNCIIGKIQDDVSYGIFWKPIEEVIGQASTVFLSADGIYNQINLESIPTPDGRFIIDNSNIVLVSNTKDLWLRKIQSRAANKEHTASIVANPTYYTDASGRRTISQLPGTEIEGSQIQFMLSQKGYNTTMYVENLASEENVKNVNNPSILHIATHGFYKPQPVAQGDELEINEVTLARNPLLRSGLLLKGAGDLMEKTEYNYNIENGILTAHEAMNMHLDKTDLVVLSACETGLGDLEAGEGVLGLQRAFLVAGSRLLFMSMFKVDDTATQNLMRIFYEKFGNSGNMRTSFIEAKKELRVTYPEPIYWGAFMMIGLE